MGLTHVRVDVMNPARPTRRARVRMLVDSGAVYSIVDRGTLRRIGIRSIGSRTFVLADGTEVIRSIGVAMFGLRGEERASTVIFGEPGDVTLLGVVTLEELGLILDPLRRELRPMPTPLMTLSQWAPS